MKRKKKSTLTYEHQWMFGCALVFFGLFFINIWVEDQGKIWTDLIVGLVSSGLAFDMTLDKADKGEL